MRFLVIGANSFSGSHFVARLLDEGHEVFGVSRSAEPAFPFLPRKWREAAPGRYSFFKTNLNHLDYAFEEFLAHSRPDFVVNFAAQGMVAQSWDSPWDWYQTNTVGLSTLLDYLRRIPSLRKYVHVSTPEVYGSTKGWIKESFEFAPTTPYATSRAAGDWHVMNLRRSMDFPAVITRSANVYGPGQQIYRIVPRAFIAAEFGETFPLEGGGTSTRSFIHIADVVEATYRLTLSDLMSDSFHISTNQLISISELVGHVAQIAGVRTEKIVRNAPVRLGQDDSYQLDSSSLRKTVGWEPQFDLNAGLESVSAWVKENRNALVSVPRTYLHKQ